MTMGTEPGAQQDHQATATEPPGIDRITFRSAGVTAASPEAVYAEIANVRDAMAWGGEQQLPKFRLLTLDAPEGEASVGTGWDSTGADPMGTFTDHSVVTTADRAGLFVCRTEATLAWKNGKESRATIIHRYEVVPEGSGSRVTYLFRGTGPMPMPWYMRAVLATPGMRQMALRGPRRAVQRGLANLIDRAAERAGVG
jgi:hypothetical protein